MIINFNKTLHTYTTVKDGQEIPLLNFSTFVEKYKTPFDTFSAGARHAKTAGGNQIEIIKGWNNNNKISQLWGDLHHLTIEGWIKYDSVPKNEYLAHFLVKFKEVVHSLGLTRKDLTSEHLGGNEELSIGGLIDICSSVVNFDLKTGGLKAKKKGNLKKPFNFIENSPVGRATLQLNFYSLFEGQEDKILRVLFWNGKEFEIIKIERFTEEQREILISEIKNYHI